MIPGSMRRGRTLLWTIVGGVVAAAALVIVLIEVNSGTPPTATSSPAPPVSAGASSQAGESAPVVTPETSGASSIAYLSDLTPSGDLGGSVTPGAVKIAGSIYPKSISFYCNVGDPTAFPVYTLEPGAREFKATIWTTSELVSALPSGRPPRERRAHAPDLQSQRPEAENRRCQCARGPCPPARMLRRREFGNRW